MRRQPRRAAGAVDRLPSGRYRVRVLDPTTGRRVSIGSYDSKREADKAFARASTDQQRGVWLAPDAGSITFRDYSSNWLRDRLTGRGDPLRPRVKELYEGLLRLHILPAFGHAPIGIISTAAVRTWYSSLLANGPGRSTAAKSYRLLKSIMNTAIEDGLILRNPCSVTGAGVERPEERPVPSIEKVYEIADAVPLRLRAFVLLGAFAGLRRGEIFGLTRANIDLEHGTVSVVEQRQQGAHGEMLVGPPKTDAGRRTVTLPPSIVPDLIGHLGRWVEAAPESLLFVGEKGAPLRPHVWQKHWDLARAHAGMPELHFHDLRHVAGTLAASTGASTRELMLRLGHASPDAALRYQHATPERDQVIASGIDRMIEEARRRQPPRTDGPDIGLP